MLIETFTSTCIIFGKAERPKLFDVRDLMLGRSNKETAEELATYFNRILCEFEPLAPKEIPCTRHKDLPELQVYEVASRIRRFRKPKRPSLVIFSRN